MQEWDSAGWFDGEWPLGIEWKEDGHCVAFLVQHPTSGNHWSIDYEIKWSENGFSLYEDPSNSNWLKIQMKRKARVGSPQQKAKYRELVRQFYGE